MCRRFFIVTIGVCMCVGFFTSFAAAQAGGTEVETVLATVDGKAVTKDDLYLAFLQSYPRQANETLNRLVNEILIENEAKSKKKAVADKEIKARAEELGITGELSKTVNSMIKTSILAEKLIISEKKIKVTMDEVKKFYDENKDKLGQPEQVHLKQIVLASEADANDLTLALNAGADFAQMAKAKSQDTASRERGGDLGFFAKGMLVPEIEKVVFEMKKGEISPIITTDAGFHILKVEERKEEKKAKYDKEMKDRLKKLILNNKIQQELAGWLEALRAKADIK